jgi:hypothetical protein
MMVVANLGGRRKARYIRTDDYLRRERLNERLAAVRGIGQNEKAGIL